jgi:hypothetical protein
MAYTLFYVFYVCNENRGKLEAYFGEIPQNQNIFKKKAQPGRPCTTGGFRLFWGISPKIAKPRI